LSAIGFEPWYSNSQGFEHTIATEYAKWGEVVREAGMNPQ
jgi:tripartite-type tricarboxylate transporter receptor subunit TctC